MNEQDSAALRGAVEDAIVLIRGNTSRLRAALSPVTDSLQEVCASLQHVVARADAAAGHAAVLVVSRDLIANALRELDAEDQVDSRAVMLGLATLHNRIVAALDTCTVPQS